MDKTSDMKEEQDDFMREDDEDVINIDFSKYWSIIKGHWKTVALWGVCGFLVGCLFALATPRKYTCMSKLAPELSSTATNRLSSMAAMIGFSSSVLGTTDAVYPMVYPDLLHSPEFIVDLFDMPVAFVDKKDSVHTTLYDYLENYSGKTAVGSVLYAPMTLMGKIMEKVKGEEESDSTSTYDAFNMTRAQGRIYKMLSKCIEADIDKKTLVVTIETSLDDRFICAQLSREVNVKLAEYVTRYRTGKAMHDRDYYQKMYEESKGEYFAAQNRYTSYLDSHQNISLQRVNVEGERLRNEAALKYQLYSSMAQQLQAAEAKVQLETPVFAEIVSPTTPLKSVNSRKKKAMGFAVLALLAGAVVVLLRNREEEAES